MNLSLGGRADDLLARLLAAADQRGIVVVVATLESPEDTGYPASLTTVIPVVTCDVNGRLAPPRWRGVVALLLQRAPQATPDQIRTA